MLNVFYSKKNWNEGKEELPESATDIILNFAQVKEFNIIPTIKNFENIFFHMQAEEWSSDGEATPIIKSLGLTHTSMSVGDFILDTGTGFGYFVKPYGWSKFDIYAPKIKEIAI